MFAATDSILFHAVILITRGQRPITPNLMTDPCVNHASSRERLPVGSCRRFSRVLTVVPKSITSGNIRTSPEAVGQCPVQRTPLLFCCCGIKERVRLFGSGLALVTSLTAGLDTLQDGFTVLVELQLGDDDVGGVNAQRDGLARDLLAGDTLNVDHVFETVDRGHFALLVLVGAADNSDLVILANGDAADLLLEIHISFD